MREETIKLHGLETDHHFTILDEWDLKELAKCGLVCISFNPDGSFSYIITEECWNKYYEKREKECNQESGTDVLSRSGLSSAI